MNFQPIDVWTEIRVANKRISFRFYGYRDIQRVPCPKCAGPAIQGVLIDEAPPEAPAFAVIECCYRPCGYAARLQEDGRTGSG